MVLITIFATKQIEFHIYPNVNNSLLLFYLLKYCGHRYLLLCTRTGIVLSFN